MPPFVKRIVDPVVAWALSLRVVRAYLLYGEKRGPALADSVTYRALFSVFAAALLGFSLAARWLADNPVAWNALVQAVDAAIPGLIGQDGVIPTSSLTAGIATATIFSVLALVLASIGAVGSLRSALRIISGSVHDTGFWLWVMVRNLLLAAGIGVAVAVSAVLTYFGTAGVVTLLGWLGVADAQPLGSWVARGVGVLVVFALDVGIVAFVFVVLSGVRPPARALWAGSLIGALGLTVLQQLSGLFVAGASANPLLATFASLIALLLWINLSAQVILIACTYVIVAAEESGAAGRPRAPATFGQRRVRRAEIALRRIEAELADARAEVAKETSVRSGEPEQKGQDA
ncbi:YihY/virulence factor BrkB family protein [Microbacterium sediminicola]|uniref:YihY/virulence factor BrkB family protein n=1 Tax=Microbacterium sediminicola TaxID=415210 RepID=A0ABN2HYF2_9MICO